MRQPKTRVQHEITDERHPVAQRVGLLGEILGHMTTTQGHDDPTPRFDERTMAARVVAHC